MITVTIDGEKVETKKGTYILDITNSLGIEIPTLCYHPSLEPYGACRLCTVEIEKNAKRRLVTSCNYPAEEGLIVYTNSEKVINLRRIIIELLLARCSKVEKISKLAERYGIKESRFGKEENNCVLCGLCVRVCEQILGVSAISFVNRGIDRKVAAPFEINSEVCIGCGACGHICPTGAIKMEDFDGIRKIEELKTKLDMAKCSLCGSPIAPMAQIEYVKRKLNLPPDIFTICQKCKRRSYARKIIALT